MIVAAVLLGGCDGAGRDPASAPPSLSVGEASTPAEVVPPPLKKGAERRTKELRKLRRLAEQAAADLPVNAVPEFPGPVLGADMSWPQCPRGMGIPEKGSRGAPLPLDTARYVVLGLTNGPGLTPNPCLAQQVEFVRERKLLAAAYAVASYPDAAALARDGQVGPYDGSNPFGALANAGYQQARYNVASMASAGLVSPVLWIDVEPVPDFEWSSDTVANAAVVQGAARGYTDSGLRVGVYSTPSLWTGVVGNLALGVPEWRAAGQTSRAEATRRCGPDWVIQGGQAVLGQWVELGRDQNITCPGVHRDLGLWFHQY
ncbi:MAG: hypothetical protein JWO11_38 [Nocardioides sp.]|nr:hypothetical protein [Nocardioides sp.]